MGKETGAEHLKIQSPKIGQNYSGLIRPHEDPNRFRCESEALLNRSHVLSE
jgi:hypothetical protein